MAFHTSKELYDGVVAEFVVMDMLCANQLLVEKGLGIKNVCITMDNKPSYPQSQKHHDLDLHLNDCKTYLLQQTKTVEVKYAYNDSYPTFFAEITQLNSQTYAEYLVYPPDFMFYVNGFDKMAYCYDGNKFVEGVKRDYDHRRKNQYNSADGVLFGKKQQDYGYLFSYPVKQNYFNVLKNKDEEIKHRLNASRGVYVNGSKTCKGLPNLT